MATCSNIPAWKIPWTEEPGGLQSMGSEKSRTQKSTQHFANMLRCSVMTWREGMVEEEGGLGGRGVCIIMADSSSLRQKQTQHHKK